jgi:YggT family protein
VKFFWVKGAAMFFTSLIFDIIQLIDLALEIYMWIVIAAAALIWLTAFKVIDKDKDSDGLKRARELLGKLTEPVFAPIRRVLKPVNGFDLAPVVVLVIIYILRSFLADVYVSNGVPHYNGSGSMPFYQNKNDHIYGGGIHP